MQGNILANYIYFGGGADVNAFTYKPVGISFMTLDKLLTHVTYIFKV